VRETVRLTLAGLLLAGILAGCGAAAYRVGYVGSSGPGHAEYRYTAFEGVERHTFHAQAGQVIDLDYEVAVGKGALSLELVAPDGQSLWEDTFRENGAGSQTVELPQDGVYTVRVSGQATAGRFDVTWRVEE
jgi:hypothetical protein